MRVSDFRSDTVTRPSEAMRRAMAEAEVGDDVVDGDPTVQRLEQRAAEWLGFEAALFVPSGTMANQVALGIWTKPGDVVIAEETAHVFQYEVGGAAATHGVQARPVRGRDGELPFEELERIWYSPDLHTPGVTLVSLEQTHMLSGGRVLPFDYVARLSAFARERGARVHVDGARLANAVVSSGIDAARWGAVADSVSLCLSKGLGAPVGSILAADAEAIERGRRVRQRLGGGMRQSGILAAAGLMALEENVARLEEDHALARELAERLRGVAGLRVPATVETNIVIAELEPSALAPSEIESRMEAAGVRAFLFPPNLLRFVTHSDVGRSDVERCGEVLEEILSN